MENCEKNHRKAKEKITGEKVKKIFDKSIYVIEYIIALLLMINIFGIIADKAYNGYFPLNKIIPSAILAGAQVAIIIYICI